MYVVEEIVRYRLFTNGILRISSSKSELNAKVIKIIVKTLIFSAQVDKNHPSKHNIFAFIIFSQDSRIPVMICKAAMIQISQGILLSLKRNSGKVNNNLLPCITVCR